MNIVYSGIIVALAVAAAPARADECKKIHADLVEVSATQGCNPGLASCFLGEVDGNHGLRGTTHFAADSARLGPATSPSFISYSGPFEYRTADGNIDMRETGVTTNGSDGVVTAYQQIVGGTGQFAGATGYFFVSGHKGGGMVTTFIDGEICHP
jgi:hypothetical protein